MLLTVFELSVLNTLRFVHVKTTFMCSILMILMHLYMNFFMLLDDN